MRLLKRQNRGEYKREGYKEFLNILNNKRSGVDYYRSKNGILQWYGYFLNNIEVRKWIEKDEENIYFL